MVRWSFKLVALKVAVHLWRSLISNARSVTYNATQFVWLFWKVMLLYLHPKTVWNTADSVSANQILNDCQSIPTIFISRVWLCAKRWWWTPVVQLHQNFVAYDDHVLDRLHAITEISSAQAHIKVSRGKTIFSGIFNIFVTFCRVPVVRITNAKNTIHQSYSTSSKLSNDVSLTLSSQILKVLVTFQPCK